jgi:hypothetical protein
MNQPGLELHASQKSLKLNHSHPEVSILSSILRVQDHGIGVLKQFRGKNLKTTLILYISKPYDNRDIDMLKL